MVFNFISDIPHKHFNFHIISFGKSLPVQIILSWCKDYDQARLGPLNKGYWINWSEKVLVFILDNLFKKYQHKCEWFELLKCLFLCRINFIGHHIIGEKTNGRAGSLCSSRVVRCCGAAWQLLLGIKRAICEDLPGSRKMSRWTKK